MSGRFYVNTTKVLELNEEQAYVIFYQYLQALKKDRWTREGKVYEEQYTSHRFDMQVGKATDPEFEVLVLVEKLEEALKARKK